MVQNGAWGDMLDSNGKQVISISLQLEYAKRQNVSFFLDQVKQLFWTYFLNPFSNLVRKVIARREIILW